MTPNDSEISDFIVDYDAQTLARRDVTQSAVIKHFLNQKNARAGAVVAKLPAKNGILDRDAIDRLLVSVHCEMQSLAEEFHHGQRLSELLRPLLTVLREKKITPPIRVVDVGCGTGYAIRWLALHGQLGDDVDLLGADYNAALVNESNRLAQEERARCKFIHANVFRLKETAHVFISTGVVHHFRGEALLRFFAEHENSSAQAYLHYDFRPSPLAPMGSWFFHIVRMRTALARHDGTLSAVRAHSAETLLQAARSAAPGFISGIYGSRIWNTPLPRVFHTVVGMRPELRDPFLKALGRRRSRMDELR